MQVPELYFNTTTSPKQTHTEHPVQSISGLLTIHSLVLSAKHYSAQAAQTWESVAEKLTRGKPIFDTVKSRESRQVTVLPLVSNLPFVISCGCTYFGIERLVSKHASSFTMPQFPYVYTRHDSLSLQ